CRNSGCNWGSSCMDQKAAIFTGTGLPASFSLLRLVASHVNNRPRISSAPRLRSTGLCAARSCFSRTRSGTALFSVLLFMALFKWDQDKMVSNRQRYQKIRNFSAVAPVRYSRVGLWLALSIGLLGCAGAERPVHSATAAEATNGTDASTPAAGTVDL